ncbi:MAG: adenylyl-sulfate kinase [Pseudomonadales bacterium]|nr:adenylyl-sulfate kinase [Pseudomonadales bacterium]
MPMSKTLYLTARKAGEARKASRDLPSWDLTPRQACDVELILNGAFAPLTGFMSAEECQTVCEQKQWRKHFWPVPIILDISEDFGREIAAGQTIALRDQEGVLVALLSVTGKFESSRVREYCPAIDLDALCLAGDLQGIEAPAHHDFKRLRLSPAELCSRFDKLGWNSVMGFATRRALHQKEVNETYNTARNIEANLLLNPAIGSVKPEDSYHYARVHCYEHVLERFPGQTTDLCLTPLYPRHLGIDDALLHALVLKNQGCSHYLLDEEYCAVSETGLDFDQLQETLSAYNDKLGIKLVHKETMVHSPRRGGYVRKAEINEGESFDEITPEEFKRRLRTGLDVPAWFSWPEIVAELRKVYRPRFEQGLTVFFTGLSGAGKSSIANALLVKMMEMGGRPITLLDGDIVRRNLSSELGFSREHRDLNIRRIGFVASEITKHGGMAICAPIAPYRSTRRAVREMVEQHGGFVEVHVSTSLEVCEERDRKGLYAKARAGIIKEFTGISDPYEEPENAELAIDTQGITPEEAAQRVILTLEKLGYIKIL